MKKPISDVSIGMLARAAINGCHDKVMGVGPVVWSRAEGRKERYFAICGCNENGFWIESVACEPVQQQEFLAELVRLGGGYFVHVHQTELELAVFAQRTWPCEKTNTLLANVSAEVESKEAVKH